MEATRTPINQMSRYTEKTMTREVSKTPKITLGPTKIAIKKPMTLAERSRAAERSRKFAEEKAKRLVEKAKQMSELGDPRAAKVAALAEKATANVQLAQARVDKVNKAVEGKAKRLGADLAQNALYVSTIKNAIKNYNPNDPGNNGVSKEGYQKMLSEAEADMKKAMAKATKFESKFPSMPAGKTAQFAEEFAKEIVKREQSNNSKNPNSVPAPSMEDMNVAMGQPPGGIKEKQVMGEAPLKQAPRPAMEDTQFTRTPGSGPELESNTPIQNKSNLPIAQSPKTPQLKQGDQGGWYYETKSGAKVYVQK